MERQANVARGDAFERALERPTQASTTMRLTALLDAAARPEASGAVASLAAALEGLSKTQLRPLARADVDIVARVARTMADAHDAARSRRLHDVGRALTTARSARVHAHAIGELAALARDDAAVRSALRGPSPQDDVRGAFIRAFEGVPSGIAFLRAAYFATLPFTGVEPARAHANAALADERLELWLPLLADAVTSAREGLTPRTQLEDALEEAHAAVEAWRTRATKRADDASSSSALREGTVAGVAIAVSLLHLGLADALDDALDNDVGALPLALLPALLDVVGKSAFAKHGAHRRALLAALFDLAGQACRVPDERRRDVVAWLHDVVRESAPRGGRALAEGLAALGARLRRELPAPQDRFHDVAARLAGQRGSEALLEYVRKLAAAYPRGPEAASLARVMPALATGTLDDLRLSTLDDERLGCSAPALARLPSLRSAWSLGERCAARELDVGLDDAHPLARAEVVDTGDVLDWVNAVNDVPSCLSTAMSPPFNRALLNRFEDGAVRLFAVRTEGGRTWARAAARLAHVDLGARYGPALLVDKPYVSRDAGRDEAQAARLVVQLAQRRARALGVPLLLTQDPSSQPPPDAVSSTELVRVFAPRAVDYLDEGRLGLIEPGADVSLERALWVVDTPAPEGVSSSAP